MRTASAFSVRFFWLVSLIKKNKALAKLPIITIKTNVIIIFTVYYQELF